MKTYKIKIITDKGTYTSIARTEEEIDVFHDDISKLLLSEKKGGYLTMFIEPIAGCVTMVTIPKQIVETSVIMLFALDDES